MKLWRAFLVALALGSTPVGAAETSRYNLITQNDIYITSNAAGQISGANLHTLLGNLIDSTGMLADTNVWSGANTFSTLPVFSTCTGYLYGNGAGAPTCAVTIPVSVLTGTGTSGHTIPFLDGVNTWSSQQILAAPAFLTFYGGSAGVDNKNWDIRVDNTASNSIAFRAVNDAYTVANSWMTVNRSGATATLVTIGPILKLAAAPIIAPLTGYLKGAGASAVTAAATVPSADFADGNSGTGAVAHVTSPSFVTPTLGVASATSVNKITLTPPATGATLTIPNGTTATLQGTDTYVGRATTDTLSNKTLTDPKLTEYTIAALLAKTCNAGSRGTLAWVNDTVGSAAPSWNATIAGGGATTVSNLAACNGTNWVYQ